MDETKGYASLKCEQGHSIPICYGLFDCEEHPGKFLLAERIKGYPVGEINETIARIKDVFEAAVRSLARIQLVDMEVDEICVILNQDVADAIHHCIFPNPSTDFVPVIAFRHICGGNELANTWRFEFETEEDLEIVYYSR